MMKKIALILGSVIFSMMLGNPTTYADEGKFTLYPTHSHHGNVGWIIEKTESGSTLQDSVTVENFSDNEQQITLLVREATNEEGQFMPKESEHYSNLGAWIHLQDTDLTLAPHEKKQIPLEINIPSEATERQYHAVIYAVKKETNSQNITVITRIGVRIYLDVIPVNLLGNNILHSSLYKNSFFFMLSLAGVLGSITYNIIHLIENKKNAKRHA